MATRTLAFQVSEELLQRIKTFLARYEQIYHRKLSQKEFLVHLIERELSLVLVNSFASAAVVCLLCKHRKERTHEQIDRNHPG